MASTVKYYLAVRPDGAVGPHKLDSLREWVARGAIGEDWLVCKEGEEAWIALSAIPRFHEYPKSVRERLDRSRQWATETWRAEAVTEKQLAKLRHFAIPFNDAGLTKGSASELIDAFIAIDPEREAQYQDRPSTAAQNKEIRSLGGDSSDLTYSEARDLIEELSREQEEKEIEWMILDNMLNDEDVHEICGYEPLSEAQLKQMLAYFSAHVPD